MAIYIGKGPRLKMAVKGQEQLSEINFVIPVLTDNFLLSNDELVLFDKNGIKLLSKEAENNG